MTKHTSPDNQRERETLSAFMDNAADELELRRILKSCEPGSELSATWERYHLAQSILHGNGRPVSPELSQRIAAQIAQEIAHAITPEPRSAQARVPAIAAWQQLGIKVAIAASVAVVFLFAVQFDPNLNNSSTPSVAEQDQPSSAVDAVRPPVSLAATDTSTPVSLDPVAQQRLREFLERVSFNEEEPVITVHIQESPLYRLVNELSTSPQ